MRQAIGWVVFSVLVGAGCDPVQVEQAKKPDASSVKATDAPFQIEPTVWGEAGQGAKYEVRELPDGRPGLFTADGGLLFHLMPEVILDVGPAGKKRTKPQRKSFDLVQLTPHEKGGFSLFGKFSDENGKYYDLRIENGTGDPRVHVAVSTKWARSVDVHRQIIVFRTGLLEEAEALAHDYTFQPVEGEFVDSAHTPNVVRFGGDAGFTAIGRAGVEGVTVRDAGEGRWDIEFEVYHYENHPLAVGDDCGMNDLGGVGRFDAGEKFEMRADLVLGETNLPLGLRFPEGKRAAVAMVSRAADDRAKILARPEPPKEAVAADTAAGAWYGESLAEVPCEGGRFAGLAARGFTTAWSGSELTADGANVFAPTEADSRRPVAFTHPNAKADADDPFELFSFVRASPAEVERWLSPPHRNELADSWGAVVVATDLALEPEAETPLQQSLRSLMDDDSVWLAPIDDLASHLVAVRSVEYDFLPHGVVRVRNPELVDIRGFSLLLPPDTTIRYPAGATHSESGNISYFDLGGRREQLLQLFRNDEPFATMSPAHIEVNYDRRPTSE